MQIDMILQDDLPAQKLLASRQPDLTTTIGGTGVNCLLNGCTVVRFTVADRPKIQGIKA